MHLLGIRRAFRASMIDVALSILALIAGGLTLELFAATWPPLGQPEERGLNFRHKALDTIEELQIGNPS
ncbi:MAG TPA: hypothetical protein VFE51_00560 [Verrucomicrobiae bacterium]|nr:hypothetical protein [Verrucomicrobiae bacterium]